MTPLPSPGIHWCEVMTVDWMGNGVLAFLAAVGIAALVWLVTGVILRRRPPEVPAVLAFSEAQITASVYQVSAGTSVKGFSAVTSGEPAIR